MAKQETNNTFQNIFSPSPSTQRINSGKKIFQPQLQPIEFANKDDKKQHKLKVITRPASDKQSYREQQKVKLFEIQKDDCNGNNIFQLNHQNLSSPLDKNKDANNKINNVHNNDQFKFKGDQKKQNILRKQVHSYSGQSPQLHSQKQQYTNNDEVSPISLFQNYGNINQINQMSQNDRNSLQHLQSDEQPQLHMNLNKNDSDQKQLQQILSPNIRIKTYTKDNIVGRFNLNVKSPTHENVIKDKINQEILIDTEKKQVSNFEKQSQLQLNQQIDQERHEKHIVIDQINQDEEFSPQKLVNPINKIQTNEKNGVEKMLHKIINTGDKQSSKQDISRPSSGRNQNFRITTPKTMNTNHNEENQHHGYVVNGSNKISRLQSKETSDTPQSQTQEKSQESSTEMQNNKNKNEVQTSQNQLNHSLQALEEEGKNTDNIKEQKQINRSNTNLDQVISSLIHLEHKQSIGIEGENSPIVFNSDKKRQESSMMFQSASSEKKDEKILTANQKVVDQNNDYLDAQVGELLGQGAYGKVYKGFIKSRGRFIAIKEMKEEQIFGDNPDSLLEGICKEIQLLKQLSHKNIVNYIGSKKQEGSIFIYMEYMPGGSISEMLKRYGGFDEEVLQKFVKQLLEGLVYLHSKGVIHRDLKGANILSDGQGNVKLADFGAARNIENILQHSLSQSEFCNSIKGSLYWMAPELIKNEKHGRRIDVWSLGCTVIEMATAQHPWENLKKFSELANAVIEQQPIPIPQHLSQECKDFISQCCTYDKKLRPKSSQLLSHPFLLKTYS